MSDNGHVNPTIVRTSRGLTVEGSRLTIYQLMDALSKTCRRHRIMMLRVSARKMVSRH